MNNREKGKRGERELANELRKYGFDARRGQQYCGANGDADVVGVPGLHIECKRVERLNVENALRQAETDAKDGEIPIVMHRANREEWKVTMRLKDFMERDKRILALEAELERTKKQMCRFCRAHDKKAGLRPICAADCEWSGKETDNENNSRA